MRKANVPSTYLVTGANRGLGLAFARALSGRGDSVIATARHPETARALHSLPVRVETLDVADDRSIEALSRTLSGQPVDVLINNAASAGPRPGVDRLAPEDLARTLRVNTIGPLAVTQALLPNLRAGRRRLVANLSSWLASISTNDSGGWSAYRISKAALNQLTRTFAAELAQERFTFVLISPGWVRTDMGGSGATLSPAESVAAMLKVLDRLGPGDTGRFYDQRGRQLPW